MIEDAKWGQPFSGREEGVEEAGMMLEDRFEVSMCTLPLKYSFYLQQDLKKIDMILREFPNPQEENDWKTWTDTEEKIKRTH